ncbi:MAG: hypothetical protein ABJC04_06485 [Verrucomicrobiota bacterium]
MKPQLSLIGLLTAIFTFSGCSSFQRDWKKATTNPPGIQGRWQGTWLSQENAHTGQLRCLMEKVSDETYRARFDSTYQKILHFKSTVLLHGRMTNDVFLCKGEAKLPWWAGGLYQYDGEISATNFFAKYNSKYDHGTFQMKRLGN